MLEAPIFLNQLMYTAFACLIPVMGLLLFARWIVGSFRKLIRAFTRN